jgi:hypothetical protein
MMRKPSVAAWMGGAFCAALGVGLVALALLGRGGQGVTFATESVARVAFVFFWLVYTGGALAALFGPRFASLARHRREFGLAFAAALLVHLAFVAWLFHISYRPPVSHAVIFYFGIGALWAYALAICSVERLRELIGPAAWRLFNAAGLEYIALLFLRDFVLLPYQYGTSHPLYYAPFSILSVSGPVLRWLALVLGRLQHWRGQRPTAEIKAMEGQPPG